MNKLITFSDFINEVKFNIENIKVPYAIGIDKRNENKQYIFIPKGNKIQVIQLVKGFTTGDQTYDAHSYTINSLIGTIDSSTWKNVEVLKQLGLAEDLENIEVLEAVEPKTFKLDGSSIAFTSSFNKDKAINVLLKTKGFSEANLMKQLGNNKGNNVVGFENNMDAKNAYQILLKSDDVHKADFDDANDFIDELYKDISVFVKSKGYNIKRTGATNCFNVQSKDGLVTAYITADPQNKF